jgi:dienelactone hydrolase
MQRLIAAAVALVLSATLARAELKYSDITYNHGDTPLKGMLVYDDAQPGKRPAVLVVPEWWGMTEYPKNRATQLAQLGYVAFVADMYGNGATTNDPKQAGALAGPLVQNRPLMRQRVQAGLDVLLKNEHVDPSKVAAIGYCFGGTTVLELARSGAPIAGVVSFHGNLSNPSPADAKNIKCKLLVQTGANDPMVTDKDVNAFMNEMRQTTVDWYLISYGNAVHAFSNPNADSHKLPGIAYNAVADRRSWQAMVDFFNELFGAPGAASAPTKK